MKTSFTGLLFLLFLGLKLTGYITWAWIWITAPLWLPLSFTVVLLGLIVLFAVIKDGDLVKKT